MSEKKLDSNLIPRFKEQKLTVAEGVSGSVAPITILVLRQDWPSSLPHGRSTAPSLSDEPSLRRWLGHRIRTTLSVSTSVSVSTRTK